MTYEEFSTEYGNVGDVLYFAWDNGIESDFIYQFYSYDDAVDRIENEINEFMGDHSVFDLEDYLSIGRLADCEYFFFGDDGWFDISDADDMYNELCQEVYDIARDDGLFDDDDDEEDEEAVTDSDDIWSDIIVVPIEEEDICVLDMFYGNNIPESAEDKNAMVFVDNDEDDEEEALAMLSAMS